VGQALPLQLLGTVVSFFSSFDPESVLTHMVAHAKAHDSIYRIALYSLAVSPETSSYTMTSGRQMTAGGRR
jgi:hypothetical protein